MPLQIFVVHPDVGLEPLAYHGAVHVIVVDPTFLAGAIGRDDADTLDAGGVASEQGLEVMAKATAICSAVSFLASRG